MSEGHRTPRGEIAAEQSTQQEASEFLWIYEEHKMVFYFQTTCLAISKCGEKIEVNIFPRVPNNPN
jgi:hypothetical protein